MATPKKPKSKVPKAVKTVIQTSPANPTGVEEKPAASAEVLKKFMVLKDSREQQGWVFEKSQFCDGTVVKGLPTGDYSIEGLEHLFCIERKQSVQEFAKNICEKRFDAEFVRMQQFKHSFVILEFTMEDIFRWPASSGLPWKIRKYIRTSPQFILKRLMDFQVQYPKTRFIFAGSYGKEVCLSLLKRIYSEYQIGA